MAKQPDFTDKQRRFCEEYIKDLNGKQAAIRAGYTPKFAEVQASKMLNYTKVKAYIKELQKKVQTQLIFDVDRILIELARCGFSNIKNYFDSDFCLKSMDELTDDMTAAISSVEIIETTLTDKYGNQKGTEKKTKFKLYNKLESLKMLGEHLNMFKQKEKDGDDQREQQIFILNGKKIIF